MKKHIHKYLRIDLSRTPGKPYLVYRCVLNCNHYIPIEQAVGKTTICWSCDDEFVIKDTDTRYRRITCDKCKGKRVRNPKLKEAIMRKKDTRDIVDHIREKLGILPIDLE
jgi:DNA-directed RNA polymerase subunit RPC12/RpoP